MLKNASIVLIFLENDFIKLKIIDYYHIKAGHKPLW